MIEQIMFDSLYLSEQRVCEVKLSTLHRLSCIEHIPPIIKMKNFKDVFFRRKPVLKCHFRWNATMKFCASGVTVARLLIHLIFSEQWRATFDANTDLNFILCAFVNKYQSRFAIAHGLYSSPFIYSSMEHLLFIHFTLFYIMHRKLDTIVTHSANRDII